MELEVESWFANKSKLGSIFLTGEIEKQTQKAIYFVGTCLVKPSTICCKCGRTLTDPVSIELGIGPICAKMDQRDSMTKEEKAAYIAEFSSKHSFRQWIPKSVIKELPQLETTKKEVDKQVGYDVEAIINSGYILVRSKYEYASHCRSIPNGKWNKAKRFWYYPESPITAKAVVDTFADVENKNIQQEIIDAAESFSALQEIKVDENLPDIPIAKTVPWEHQKQAFWFSKNLDNAGLLFRMGEGKTKVAIDLVANSEDSKVLIICPDKVVRVWPKEFDIHCGREFTVVPCEVRGKKISTDKKAEIASNAYYVLDNVAIVVNYESSWRGEMGKFLRSVEWDRIILDESQKIKSPDSKVGEFVCTLRAKRKLILTGTLLHHNPMDGFNQYRFLDRSVFGSAFYKYRNQYAIMGGFQSRQIVGYRNLDELHEKIHSIAFRAKEGVIQLPPVQHIVREFDMNREAERYYSEARDLLHVTLGEDVVDTSIVIVQLLRMQQITSGYLPIMEEYEDENGKLRKKLVKTERIDSGKADLLLELLEEISEPVVVFCRFQHDLDEIKAAAEKLGKTYGEISGRSKTALSEKAELQDGIEIAGVQIQAGGAGIDLTKARYGIYYSVGHSLGDYEQSLARIHRPGQEKPVIYYHLVAAESVDGRIYRSLSSGKDVVKSIMEKRSMDES